ncbi:Glycosyltransferase, GT2 family OS=Bosea thiooxidans OX=53254 GN=ARD30_00080 PE=4 SV=1 [Bosea thiooxidans]
MSEVIVPERTAVSPAPTVAWTPLGENAILVMSACDAMPAKVPVAVDGNPANRAHTMVLSWRRAQADAGRSHRLPLPGPGSGHGQGRQRGAADRPARAAAAPDPGGQAAALASFLPSSQTRPASAFPSIVDGLLEVLLTGTPNPRRLRAVAMLLQTVARPGGFVEVMGTLEPDGVFLQGWTSATSPPAGPSC